MDLSLRWNDGRTKRVSLFVNRLDNYSYFNNYFWLGDLNENAAT